MTDTQKPKQITSLNKCPYCGRKALTEIRKLYHFDVRAWRTVTFTEYKCRWCKRFVEYPDD